MMANDGAARPPIPGASVAFLIGTRAAGVDDELLDQAAKWVGAIRAAVGAGVWVDDLGAPGVAANTLRAVSGRAAREGKLTAAQLDKKLGGLRGHSLVLITRGLEADGGALGPQQETNGQGILFHNNTAAAPQNDLVLTKRHLDLMTVQSDRVVPGPGAAADQPANAQTVSELAAFASTVDAMRQSVFAHVYLATCGGRRRLDAFAVRLRELTGMTVFFNRDAIFFPSAAYAPRAEVGTRVSETQVKRSKGFAYFAARRGAPSVGLVSAGDGFLPGSMERLP
jgi:hypothetical protein